MHLEPTIGQGLLVGLIMGALCGVFHAIDVIKNPQRKAKSSAVRRAQREDCRRKGL